MSDSGARPPRLSRRELSSSLNALDLALHSQRLEIEGKDAVRALLPLLDHLDGVCRGFAALSPGAQQARAEAVEGLAEEGEELAARLGLSRVAALGDLANADLHEVVDVRTVAGRPRGSIVDVLEPGWTQHGVVLRRARVVATAPPAGDETTEPRPSED